MLRMIHSHYVLPSKAYLIAPKVGRKTPEGSTPDEPHGWESREFLRNKLVGKEVLFKTEYKIQMGMTLMVTTSKGNVIILYNYRQCSARIRFSLFGR